MADLDIAPGYVTEFTPRDAKGRWKNGNYARFGKNGKPMKLGGCVNQLGSTFLGKCRRMYPFLAFNLKKYLALGTHLRFYIYEDGLQSNVTPIENSTAAPFSATPLSNPFTTSAGTTTVTVTHAAHTREVGSFVTFSNSTASPVDGILITGTYQVVTVPNANTYTITHTVTATNTEVGFGDSSVDFEYEINVGNEYNAVGDGWGGGTWGTGTWGTPRTGSGIRIQARTYSIDGWGEDIVFCPRGKPIYFWDTSAGVAVRATVIANAPITNEFIIVSPEDRHLISLGAHDGSSSDPLLVRWCSQENYNDWTPSPINTAGDKRLDRGNRIVTAAYTRKQIIILTDTSAYSMSYIGYPDVFSIVNIAGSCGGISPNCLAVVNDDAYWMGTDDFYMSDSGVIPMQCDVHAHVFKNLNKAQKDLITVHIDTAYNEVTWQYPTLTSTEVNAWVTYNYLLKCWYYGTWDSGKTVMIDKSASFETVMAASTGSYLVAMNTGTDENTSAVSAYVESYDFDRGDGGNTMVSQVILDFLRIAGSVDVSLNGKTYPNDPNYTTKGPVNFTSSTPKKDIRIRKNLISMKISSSAVGDDWAIGTIQTSAQPAGKR